jgi:hypothetical protein
MSIRNCVLFLGCTLLIFSGCSDGTNNEKEKSNYLTSIEGKWDKDDGTYNVRFEINNRIVVFWQLSYIKENSYDSAGSFVFSSEEEGTINILDYNKNVVSFSVRNENGQLIVSNLNQIRIFNEPLEPRDYRFWNGKYKKVE